MTAAARRAAATPVPAIGHPVLTKGLVSPLPTSQCRTQLGIACYCRLQYRVAYDLNPHDGSALPIHHPLTGPS